MSTYLQVDFKTGTAFQYSGSHKEGFEEHTNSKGDVSYRKYFKKGVFGTLLNASVRDSKIGPQLQIALKVGDEYTYLQTSLHDQKGNIADFAESLIRFLPNLKKDTDYRFFPYVLTADNQRKYDVEQGKEPRKKYYDSRGFSVKLADLTTLTVTDKVEAAIGYNKPEENDATKIPAIEWEPGATEGKMVPEPVSVAVKKKFLTAKLKEATEGHLKYEDNSSSSSSSTTAQTEPATATATSESAPPAGDDHDDLPF